MTGEPVRKNRARNSAGIGGAAATHPSKLTRKSRHILSPESYRMHVSAVCRFTPSPPARVLSRYTKVSEPGRLNNCGWEGRMRLHAELQAGGR